MNRNWQAAAKSSAISPERFHGSLRAMNAPMRPVEPAPHGFTGADVLRMQEIGVLEEGGAFELIEGEIIDMPAEGDAHQSLRMALTGHLVRSLSGDIAVCTDGTLRLSDADWPEPDFHLYPATMSKPSLVRGPDVLLIIELSESSLPYDLRRKADLYRRFGVREYWVIDLNAGLLHVHRADGAWPAPPAPLTTTLEPVLLPGLTVRIADFLAD
jgi:Uma2 family endonuclease